MSVRFSVSLNVKLLTLMVLVLAFSSATVFAQCRFPACSKGERYDAKDQECRSGPDPITRAESHHPPTCPDGERLDLATGQCVLSACDEGCEVRELCRSREHYARSGRDREGAYGVCESSSGLGYRSHRLVHCPDGFTLNERRGVCVRCRTVAPVLFPDLVIRRAYLRLESSPAEVKTIVAGTRYLACFEVANVGRAPSGAFRVGGGGLGVPTPPFQNHASLLPGESRDGCLTYPTTPSAGTYRLGLTADSLLRVRETREDNNAATIVVNVVRR